MDAAAYLGSHSFATESAQIVRTLYNILLLRPTLHLGKNRFFPQKFSSIKYGFLKQK